MIARTIFKKLSQFFLSALILFSGAGFHTSYSKVVIWDLGGVCFNPNKFGMLKQIGFWNILTYLGNPQPATFRALEAIWGPQVPEKGCPVACHGVGALSQAMCNWQKGILSGQEIIATVCTLVDDGELDDVLASNREKRIVKALTSAMFDPLILAKNMDPVSEAVKLLEACDTQDNTMVILSNFDPDGFEALYNRDTSRIIFDHFAPENILVSGYMGTIKPYSSIYAKLKERLIELDERFADPEFMKQECLFLDDQPENVETAIAHGIPAIQINNGDYSEARQALVAGDFIK